MIGITLNLNITLRKTDILTILSLPIHENGMYRLSSLWFLSSELCSFSHIDLVHILLVFNFCSANVNSIVFLFLNSTCSLLVYRKVIGFCILTLYPTTCYNCSLVPGVFLSNLSNFLYKWSCHLWIKTVLFLPSEEAEKSSRFPPFEDSYKLHYGIFLYTCI